jgi:uncharacterized protein YdcH (DUF465 family)
MEKRDEDLIAELIDQNEELKRLVEAHRNYESRLDDFNKRPYLTTQESMERKTLQKQKLAGKDKIEAILAQHRKR